MAATTGRPDAVATLRGLEFVIRPPRWWLLTRKARERTGGLKKLKWCGITSASSFFHPPEQVGRASGQYMSAQYGVRFNLSAIF